MLIRPLLFAAIICGFTSLSNAGSVCVPVPGFPVGRCVKVLNIQTPEEAGPAGFEYLELAMQDLLPLSEADFETTVKRLKALPIHALSGYGFLPADLKILGPDMEPQRMGVALRNGLARAKRLELKMVIFGNLLTNLRKVPAGILKADAQKQFEIFCRAAAEEGARHGIVILIEPIPAPTTDLINNVAEALALVEKVNHPNLQLLVEYSILVKSKEDLAILEKAASHIRQIEIQNPNGWIYPKNADESDYASFFKALKKGNYQGSFSIHGKPADVAIDAPKAIALIRSLTREYLAPEAPGK
ncbi:MAG: hypothetical protein JWM04_2670 [Verrucomicrobiales bacterium]|nr:hypothetical protein [Verrucomicrobiales bacterium]